MGFDAMIERREWSRLSPAPARAVAAGDSVLVASSWKRWADGAAIARWDALALNAAEPNPFFESWFLLPALRRFDSAGKVEILRFERGGQLVGLMPIERNWRYQRWPLPHLRTWHHPNCFAAAPLVAKGCERAFWTAFLAWADANGGPALFAHLPEMPLDGKLPAALRAEAAVQGRRIELVHREKRALLDSDLAPAKYREQALSPERCNELRRQHARLSDAGKLKLDRYDDERCLATWIDHFLALETMGLKNATGSMLAAYDATAGLFRDALRGAGERGRLQRLSLTLDGRPVAMLANFITPPGAFAYKTAIDERFASFSPGEMLQLENLALLEHPGVGWCDTGAAADQAMPGELWAKHRGIGRFSVAIGGAAKRAAFDRLVGAELSRSQRGTAA